MKLVLEGPLGPVDVPEEVLEPVAAGDVLLTVTPKLDVVPPLQRHNSVGTPRKLVETYTGVTTLLVGAAAPEEFPELPELFDVAVEDSLLEVGGPILKAGVVLKTSLTLEILTA